MSRIARRVHQAGVYFVTTDTWQRRPIFAKPKTAQIVLEQLLDCRSRGFYKLHAFVIMPDHMHMLITPGESSTIEKAVQMIKGGSARRIGVQDRHRFPIWHAGFHDRWIRSADEYREIIVYIELNPLARMLVQRAEEYEFGSANGRHALDPSRFDRS